MPARDIIALCRRTKAVTGNSDHGGRESKQGETGVGASQKTILLVDDDALVARSQSKLLAKQGFAVITASNGTEAIAAALSDEPRIDLILMDIDLGEGIDGTDTAKLILRARSIPLIFLSSHTEMEIMKKAEAVPSCGYVVKGTGIALLTATIRRALEMHGNARGFTKPTRSPEQGLKMH
ncbi:MAG: response regulator [Spirochaetes bacterium]|nr:response regulator [Spirochaetota bacterium]